jgi:valyl-tRNA synthetase
VLSKLQRVVEEANDNFEKYVFNIPLQSIRSFVWHELADYYLEMVKHRLYKPEIYGEESKKAAQYTLNTVLETVLKLLAPVTPHISEEIYNEMFNEKSVHLTEYPEADKKLVDEEAEKEGEMLVQVVDLIRKYKTDNNLSLGAELEKVVVETPDTKLLKVVEEDIKGTGRISKVEIKEGKELKLIV